MFYGSIMSGLITFLGVLLTIHHENIERRKDDTIKYKPILEVEGVNLSVNSIYREVGLGYGITIANDNPDKERIMKKFSEHQCGDYAKCRVYIRNIGRGETSNAKIEKFEVSDTNWNDISNIYSNISTPLYIGEIIPNKYIAIGIKLPQYLMLPKTNEENKCFTISTNLYINYSDMFDRIKYQYIIHMKFAIIIEKIVTDAPDVPNDEYQYVKAAKELGIPEGTIHTWLKAVRAGTLDIGDGAHTPESAMSLAEELAMLRKRVKDQDKEIRRLKEENEFLEEASAFFAASRRKSARTKE